MARRPENAYLKGFKLAIGLRPGFRRTGPATMINIAVASLVGVISGNYIFKQPLEDYWREKRLQEAQEQGTSPTPTSQPAGANNGKGGS